MKAIISMLINSLVSLKKQNETLKFNIKNTEVDLALQRKDLVDNEIKMIELELAITTLEKAQDETTSENKKVKRKSSNP